jgi:hypothetical protein
VITGFQRRFPKVHAVSGKSYALTLAGLLFIRPRSNLGGIFVWLGIATPMGAID